VGLILDSSVVIAGERRDHTVRQILEQFKTGYGEIEIGLSVVTIVELTHGIQRAGTEERRQRRQAFVDELIRDVPVHPITIETARLAGRVEGGQAAHGVSIAFEDLLIAATALQLGFGVATGNVRHFQRIPGLNVVKAYGRSASNTVAPAAPL
jgi:predicted nucleic acid-binding protein